MIGYICIAAILAIFIHSFYWKRKSLPPGPLPFPLIGNLFELKSKGITEALTGFHKTYGDLYTFWMGTKAIVTFNSYEIIQEAFVKNPDVFAGRPKNLMMNKILRGGSHGIIVTDGHVWREHRRFALHVLRNFGLGKNLMQERVLNEVTWMIDEMKKQIKNGEIEISVQNGIDVAVGSIINSLIFGYAFHEKSLDEFFKIKEFIKQFIRMSANPLFRVLSIDSKIIRHLPIFRGLYAQAEKLGTELKLFFDTQIEERKAKIDFTQDTEPTDYVEAYLRQQQKLKKIDEKDDLFSNPQLLGSVFDMWLAGQETTSNTLAWMVLYLMTNPKAQEKLQDELTKVIGSDRIITLDDKMNLPYVNAVVAETQRLCNLVPNNVPHRSIQDVEFHGYTIKADTIVVPQISRVLYNEKIFPEPLKFKPERFRDENGKFQTKAELIPFSIGKRACLGEGLARLELYLFAANMFNQFEISIIPSKPPNLTRIQGGTVQSEPFLAHLKQRYL